MEPESTDQTRFDAEVDRVGRRLLPIAAGAGVLAAITMSAVALTVSTSDHTTTMMLARPTVAASRPATPAVPSSASILIDHVTRGCHALAVNGGMPRSPSASIPLAVGGTLHLQNNDVMPHRVILVSGPGVIVAQPTMGHMGAKSTITLTRPGTYRFTTKPGEDYTKGIVTTGPDNVLKINVRVTA